MPELVGPEGTLSVRGKNDRALLAAMPLRHLASARALCEEEGSVVLPAGSPGALDETPMETPVLFIATEAGDDELPAATWGGTFAGRVAYEPGEPLPGTLPPTWLDEHGWRPDDVARSPNASPPNDSDDDDDRDDDDLVGPQSFFRINGLSPLPRSEWIYANELVPKQRRGGRTFVPRTPELIARPD